MKINFKFLKILAVLLKIKFAVIFVTVFLTSLSQNNRVEAHAAYIFAWQENEQLCTESYYNGGKKIIAADVFMYTADGLLLAQHKSDEQGQSCFSLPSPLQNLKFKVNDGMGHAAEFTFAKTEAVELTNLVELDADFNTATAATSKVPVERVGSKRSWFNVFVGIVCIFGLAAFINWIYKKRKK